MKYLIEESLTLYKWLDLSLGSWWGKDLIGFMNSRGSNWCGWNASQVKDIRDATLDFTRVSQPNGTRMVH